MIRKWFVQKIILISVVMSLAVVLVGCSMPDDKNANIRKLCKEEALSQLKTPSVAKFANSFYQDRNILLHKEGEYLLPSAVDSQNSFGAMLRSEKWRITST